MSLGLQLRVSWAVGDGRGAGDDGAGGGAVDGGRCHDDRTVFGFCLVNASADGGREDGGSENETHLDCFSERG